MTHSHADLKRLLDQHDIRLSRALGQNFVGDPNTVRRIARMAGVGPGDQVIEVGAGLGSLTLALAETGADVVAIELDKRVAPVLRTIVEPAGATVIEADALAMDWVSLAKPGAVVVANLPYNVGTHIVTHVLDHVGAVSRLVVMLQKEVAQRLAAQPGNSAYGALSVKVRFHGSARVLGTVPPAVFVPRPDVESALVEICRYPEKRFDVDADALFALVRTAFGQRRKMLRRTLGGVLSDAQFDMAGIAPTARPEELAVEDWVALLAAQKNQ